MYSKILLLAAILAIAVAVDLSTTTTSFTGSQGINTELSVSLKNEAGSGISAVSFTVVGDSSAAAFSYPSGATKSTVGSISTGATGTGFFYVMGAQGSYTLIIQVSYRKGVVNYSQNFSANLAIQGSGDVKRDVEAELEDDGLAWVTDATITENPLTARGVDINLTPTTYTCVVATQTWFTLIVSAVNSVKSVTYGIFPSDTSVLINYGSSTSLGNINSGTSKSGSFSITGGNTGSYTLNIIAQYKKGVSNTQYYEYLAAPLQINGNGDTK